MGNIAEERARAEKILADMPVKPIRRLDAEWFDEHDPIRREMKKQAGDKSKKLEKIEKSKITHYVEHRERVKKSDAVRLRVLNAGINAAELGKLMGKKKDQGGTREWLSGSTNASYYFINKVEKLLNEKGIP